MANVKEVVIHGYTEDPWWMSAYMEGRTKGSADPEQRRKAIAMLVAWCWNPIGGIKFDYQSAHWRADKFEFTIAGEEAINERAVAAIVAAVTTLGGVVDYVYTYDLENRGGGQWAQEAIAAAAQQQIEVG